jgi:hypothetical protein
MPLYITSKNDLHGFYHGIALEHYATPTILLFQPERTILRPDYTSDWC